jgi:hypothetical protein
MPVKNLRSNESESRRQKEKQEIYVHSGPRNPGTSPASALSDGLGT